MSRYSRQTSYGHRIQHLGHGDYRLSWTVDRYYDGVRGRFPRRGTRDTDEAGAKRFAKRWRIAWEAPK